ncbi:MAG: OmpA family protein [Flavobacteriales bacterium]
MEYYLLNSIAWENQSISFSKSPRKLISDLNEVVKTGVKFNDYEDLKDFKGFSPTVKKKVENMAEMNYSQTNDSQQLESVLTHQMTELVMLLRTELLVFGGKDIYEPTEQVFTDLTLEEKEALIQEIENYQEGDLLDPLTIEYTEKEAADGSELNLESSNNTDIFERILELLAQNSQRLERLESELLQLDIERNAEVGSGLSIATLDKENELLELLPEQMDFYFSTGSSGLTSATLLQLNEVVEILAISESIKVVITGFTDDSGAADANLELSKLRAQAVQRFMKNSGLSEDRFVINYFGEAKTGTDRNEDRRVEIKFYN